MFLGVSLGSTRRRLKLESTDRDRDMTHAGVLSPDDRPVTPVRLFQHIQSLRVRRKRPVRLNTGFEVQ